MTIHALNVTAAAASPDRIDVSVIEFGANGASPGSVIIEVRAAGINPSDAKAMLGMMPHAVWPRTPGRDYAGVVIDGPREWIGREVWGSGGELGIRRDGTHATHVIVDVAAVREKPSVVALLEVSAIAVPFITAYQGL